MFLDQEELTALTNRKVRPAQVKVLKAMGIDHKIRPDGSVVVLRDHITKVFNGHVESSTKTKTAVPNWDAM